MVQLIVNIWYGEGRPDSLMVAAHVLAQMWRRRGIDVVCGRDAMLFEDQVRAGRAVLEGTEDVLGDGRCVGDRAVRVGEEHAEGVSYGVW